mmetsp:Transcript_20079/g.55698  ORF Transcript_20079/g.55698 Transcript_20079/m.55698 type:complete len:111 (-) Transcript_20079:28-360(-)
MLCYFFFLFLSQDRIVILQHLQTNSVALLDRQEVVIQQRVSIFDINMQGCNPRTQIQEGDIVSLSRIHPTIARSLSEYAFSVTLRKSDALETDQSNAILILPVHVVSNIF